SSCGALPAACAPTIVHPRTGTASRGGIVATLGRASVHERPHTAMSVFEHVTPAPADPILGLTEAFVKDDRPGKVNLGVGVYLDEDGRIPLLDCVRRAERSITEAAGPHGYLPIDGFAQYVSATRELVFGADSDAVADGRV